MKYPSCNMSYDSGVKLTLFRWRGVGLQKSVMRCNNVDKIDRNVYLEACFSPNTFELNSCGLLWDGTVAKQNS